MRQLFEVVVISQSHNSIESNIVRLILIRLAAKILKALAHLLNDRRERCRRLHRSQVKESAEICAITEMSRARLQSEEIQ